jgi:hypothetical protein
VTGIVAEEESKETPRFSSSSSFCFYVQGMAKE